MQETQFSCLYLQIFEIFAENNRDKKNAIKQDSNKIFYLKKNEEMSPKD